jgi:hypothetical protein
MTAWIIIGLLDLGVLLGFRRLGGIGAAAGVFTDWGCAAGRIGDKSIFC